jgi:hypothetical protein
VPGSAIGEIGTLSVLGSPGTATRSTCLATSSSCPTANGTAAPRPFGELFWPHGPWFPDSGSAKNSTIRAIGKVPTRDAVDTDGLDIGEDDLSLLLRVDAPTWRREAALISEHLPTFGSRLPRTLRDQHDLLRRLG